MENNIETLNIKIRKILISSSIISLILLIINFVLYLNGGIVYRDVKLNPIEAFKFITRLENLFETDFIYMAILISIGTIYIIMLVKQILCIINTIKNFKKLKNSDGDEIIKNYELLQNSIFKSAFDNIILLAILALFHNSYINLITLLIIINVIAIYFNKEIVLYLTFTNDDNKKKIIFFLEKGLLILLLTLFGINILNHHAYNLSNGIAMIFYMSTNFSVISDAYSAYHFVIRNIIFIIIAVKYLVILYDIFICLKNEKRHNKIKKYKFIPLIILILCFMFIDNSMENNYLSGKTSYISILFGWLINDFTLISILLILVATSVLLNKDKKIDNIV